MQTDTDNNKQKRIRLASNESMIDRIKKLPLETRLEILGLLKASIAEDKKNIEDQLNLINSNGTK